MRIAFKKSCTFGLRFGLASLLIAATAARPADAQSVGTFAQRAQVVLNAIPSTAAGIEKADGNTQFELFAAESLYMKGIDSEGKTLLLNALPQLHETATPDDDAFNLIAAVDVLERWNTHFTPNPDPSPSQNLPALFQSALTGFQYWNDASTSNQVLMQAVARYLAQQTYPTATFASDFAANDPNGAIFLACFMTQVETHNLQEYDSDVYTGAYLVSFRLLADYAQDPVMKQAAQLTYDWLLINAASTWMNSTWAATSYRRYFDIAPQNQMENGSWTLWPLFGGPVPGGNFNIDYIQDAIQTVATCQCVSGYVNESGAPYVPRQEILDLLGWSTAPNAPSSYQFQARTYTPSSTSYQYMQDSYITPNYALFGETDFDTATGNKQALQPPAQVLSGVVWNPSSANAAYPSMFYAGAPRWQVDTAYTSTTAAQCTANSTADCAVENHTIGFGQHGQYFQNQNAQLAVYNYNYATTLPEANQFYIYAPLCTANQYPYTFATSTSTIPNFPCTTATVPLAMITSETATLGHLYLYYDNVLISLWLSAPFTWDGLHEITAYIPSNLSANSILASAIEVASPSAFAGSTPAAILASYAAYMDAHATLNSAGLTGNNPAATYTTSSGTVMQNVFGGQNSLGGTAVAYANWPLMQTPWVQQSWLSSVACVSCYAGISHSYPGVGGGGNLTVTSPVTGNQLVYNYTNETVTELLAQTISFPALTSPVLVGSKATLNATAGSGLAVTYSITGPATLSGSSVTYTGAGAVQITATQAGNSAYLPATSVQTVTVVNGSTTTLTYTPAAPTFGATITFTAAVAPQAGTAMPGGTVAFYDGTNLLGTKTASGGQAALQISTLAAGPHSLTAVYSGDGNYATSTSTIVNLTITAAQTALGISAAPSNAAFGSSITFTARLTPGSSIYAGELITFSEGTSSLGTSTLDATGTATFTTSALTAGTHNINASYSGDTDYGPATTSTAAQVIVAALSTTTTLTATPSTAASGSPVYLNAAVKPVSGSAAAIEEGHRASRGSSIGTGVLNSAGVATLTVTTLAVGGHTLTASYATNGNFAASTTSQSVTVTVNPTPNFSAASSEMSLTVQPGASATAAITITPLNNYSGTVAMSCGTGLPVTAVCTVAPSTLSFLSTSQVPQSTTLTVTVAATRASADRSGFFLAWLLWIPAGLLLKGLRRRRPLLLMLVALSIFCGLSGCATPASNPANITGTFTTSVAIGDGVNSHPITLTVTIP
jgi:hypothetical protein